jgi:membrane protein
MIKKALHFIKTEIWDIELKTYPPVLGFLIRQLRIILLATRGFRENRIQLRASALTYYSMLSIVPVAAMVFGIAKGFGFQKRLENELRAMAAEREELAEVFEYVLNFANSMLENINSGLITGVGLVLLLWSVMKVLGNIESSFNAIWQIHKGRAFIRKFSDYLSMMLVAPILFFLSSTITVYLSNAVSGDGVLAEQLNTLVQFLVKLIPYGLMFMLFTIVYVVMPNTKVNFKYGLYAGLIAGVIFQGTQSVYFYFQSEAVRASAIYGTFVTLPLFLIWLQISWLIVLLGAEISFAYQNIEKYEFEREALHISPYNRRMLTFLVMHSIVKKFKQGGEPLTTPQISHELGIPIRLVREIVYDLTKAGLVVEATTESPKENAMVPSMDINQITVAYMVNKLETSGDDRLVAEDTPNLEAFSKIQQGLLAAIEKSPVNKLLKDI